MGLGTITEKTRSPCFDGLIEDLGALTFWSTDKKSLYGRDGFLVSSFLILIITV
jgi:hypothetical protein